jgi:hypothetical protein
MTARAPYRAPQLTELGSVAQMTQVNIAPVISVAACLNLQATINLLGDPLGVLQAQINADGGCALAAVS